MEEERDCFFDWGGGGEGQKNTTFLQVSQDSPARFYDRIGCTKGEI